MGCNVGKSILVIGILRNSSWSIIDNYYLMTHTWEFYLHCQYLWRQKSHKTSRKHAFFYVLVLMHLSRKKHKLIWIKLEVLHLIMSNKHIPKHHFFWQNCTLTNWSKCETRKSSIYQQHLNAFFLSLWNYRIGLYVEKLK